MPFSTSSVTKYFSVSNLPLTLIVIGVALNLLDAVTFSNPQGGLVYGVQRGFLSGLDEKIGNWAPGQYQPHVGGDLILLGAIWWLYNKYL
jgi:hypothetical protein